MNDGANDNFQYILQLTKLLTTECRSARQETDKIESLLRRVARQSNISYEKLGDIVPKDVRNFYDRISQPTEIEVLVKENYDLLYQIEQQEYLQVKVMGLIRSINEHLFLIKNFIVEQRLGREQDLDNFLYEVFDSKKVILESSLNNLKEKEDTSRQNIEFVTARLRELYKQINWELVPKDTKVYKKLQEKITSLNERYGIDLLDSQSP